MKNAAHHQGLSEQQVQENRTRYGVNILTPPEKEPLWKQFLEKFSDPIIKILLVALLRNHRHPLRHPAGHLRGLRLRGKRQQEV